nr:MAG TPA: hypothetical protein [Bacteriophage sp.]
MFFQRFTPKSGVLVLVFKQKNRAPSLSHYNAPFWASTFLNIKTATYKRYYCYLLF